MKGRIIQDNIALASEMIQDINHETRGGNIVLKLGMEKAYDRLEWPYLECDDKEGVLT